MNPQIKANSQKLQAAGLDTVFSRAFSPADIDRLVRNAKEAIASMKSDFNMRDEVSENIVSQADQAKAVLFNV